METASNIVGLSIDYMASLGLKQISSCEIERVSPNLEIFTIKLVIYEDEFFLKTYSAEELKRKVKAIFKVYETTTKGKK